MRASPSSAAVALAAALVALAGCGESTTRSALSGEPCARSIECISGLCLDSPELPGGYCTDPCDPADPLSCGASEYCLATTSGLPSDAGFEGVCVTRCTSSVDCTRAGYVCRAISAEIADMVCVGE